MQLFSTLDSPTVSCLSALLLVALAASVSLTSPLCDAVPFAFAASPSVLYNDAPSVKWTSPSAVSSLSRGNAVALSPDDALVLITSSDGDLRAFESETGPDGGGYTVSPLPLGEGWSVRCESGVSFYSASVAAGGGGDGDSNVEGVPQVEARSVVGSYYVYAIVDVPPGSGEVESSRVIAYNNPRTSTQPRWISPAIPGSASGTPVISSDGRYVYLTLNAPKTAGADEPLLGHFSVLSDAQSGVPIFTQSSTDLGTPDPWAPVGIVHNPTEGNYLGGLFNNNDLVAWGHLPGSDYFDGYVHGFQLPPGFAAGSSPGESPDTSEFQILTLHESSWSTESAPCFGSKGYTLLFSSSWSRVQGWTEGRRFDDSTNFMAEMARGANEDDDPSPPPNSATLSMDETTVFAAAAAPKIYAFFKDAGADRLWEVNVSSVAVSRLVASPDGTRVYAVESADGKVHGLNATDGAVLWTYEVDGGGKESVSEFAVSPDGTTLYRGFSDGTVTALALGKMETLTPTITPDPAATAPTLFPAAPSPTVSTPRPTNRWETQPPAATDDGAVPGAPTPAPTYWFEVTTPAPTNWWQKATDEPSSALESTPALVPTVSLVPTSSPAPTVLLAPGKGTDALTPPAAGDPAGGQPPTPPSVGVRSSSTRLGAMGSTAAAVTSLATVWVLLC